MSHEPKPAKPDAAAQDIQMKASRWVIERNASSGWTDEDQVRLDAWLNESTAHTVAYWRADHAWDRTYRVAALKRSWAAGSVREGGGAFGIKSLKIAGAVCAFAVSGWAAASIFLGPKYAVYTTPVGGHEILTLSDESQIELNTDSVLRLYDSAERREAILDKGEAYFEIRHDAAHPFVVRASGRKITDVGTKFFVRDGADHLEVALLEGRVLLSAPEGSAAAPSNLSMGDVATATATATSIAKQSPPALVNAVSWRQGVLVFHRTALADAAAEFNRYNSHKLVVTDLDSAKLKIDGKFRTNDVAAFVEVAEDVLGLRIEKRGDQTVMSR